MEIEEEKTSNNTDQPPVGLVSEQPTNQASVAQPVPAPAQNTQTETWKTVMTIIFLFLFPPIGIILIWAITNWSKKAKIIITVVYGLITIIAIISYYLQSLQPYWETGPF